jgi:hypothetical protein
MNRLLHNWNLKLTSLVLAIALWSHVRGEINPLETGAFTVPLEANIPAGFALSNPKALPATVRVSVRAPRTSLRQVKGGIPANPLAPPDEAPLLSSRYFRAYLDSAALRAGADSVAIKVNSNVEGAEILDIKPSDISIVLVKK